MFYRIHSSIINIFKKNPLQIDHGLIEEYLDLAEKSPFALANCIKSTEQIPKDDISNGMWKPFVLISKPSPSFLVRYTMIRFLLSLIS